MGLFLQIGNMGFMHCPRSGTSLNTSRIVVSEASSSSSSSSVMAGTTQKKLRRLPHVFGKVLELPFRSDADVVVQETPKWFRFTVVVNDFVASRFGRDVKAHAVEILPGVTKIVIRGNGGSTGQRVELLLDKLEVDAWRFRLPASTRPEQTSAVLFDRELIITVPKGDGRGQSKDGREVLGGLSRLVLVQ